MRVSSVEQDTAALASLANHEVDTTSVHGFADTAVIEAHPSATTAHAAATNLIHTTGAENKTGVLTMASQLLGTAGSVSTVGVAVGEAGVGMYRFSAGRGALAAGGVRAMDWQSTQVAIDVPLRASHFGLGAGTTVNGALESTVASYLGADWTSGNTFSVNPGDGALFSGYVTPYPVKMGGFKFWVTDRTGDSFTINPEPTTTAIAPTSPYGTGAVIPAFFTGEPLTICLTDGFMSAGAGATLVAVFNQAVSPRIWLPPTGPVHSLPVAGTGREFTIADMSGNAAAVPIDIGIYNRTLAFDQINTSYGSVTYLYNFASQNYIVIARS